MNTLNQGICGWVADKEGIRGVTDYPSWMDCSHIWPSCWTSHVSHRPFFLGEIKYPLRKQAHLVSEGAVTASCSSSYCYEEWWHGKFGYFSCVFQYFDKCGRRFFGKIGTDFSLFVCFLFHFPTLYTQSVASVLQAERKSEPRANGAAEMMIPGCSLMGPTC